MANITPLNQRFYRYTVESFNVLFEGDDQPVVIPPSMVNSVMIEKDFDVDYFPILAVKVMLTSDLYFRIVENKDSVKFRFRMQKYIYDPNSSTPPFKKDVFNDIFTIFLDENTPFIEKQMYERTKSMLGEGSAPQDVGGKEFTLFLFKESDLTNSKKIINNVIGPVTMTGALTYCLATAGIKNILLAPLDNKRSYKDVLLPPFTLLGNLEYLENQYGFFYAGLLAFFDLDRTYMIDYSGKCKAWAKGEYKKTVFNVKYDTNPDNLSPGLFNDENQKTYYINIFPGGIVMKSPSFTADHIEGNNIYFVDPVTGAVNMHKAETYERGEGSYRVMVDKYNNVFIRTSQRLRREEMKNIIEVTMGDFDIDAITPNKEFVFTFEDKSISSTRGGNYRLSRSVFTFTKQGEAFAISASALFKKIS